MVNYIGSDPNVCFEKPIVCFVNDEFPLETQMNGVIDATARWFNQYGSKGFAKDWESHPAPPVIYKCPDSDELISLNNFLVNTHLVLTSFTGLPLAMCIGPKWSNQLGDYDEMYERIERY